jgi:dTMP kinase
MTVTGKFITLEGSEGAGKSTNLDVLCDVLAARGIDFYRTREPGGTPMAEALRAAMLGDWQEDIDGMSELLLVFAARNQHLLNEIRPRLSRGQWVVCDRFTDATYAYQGVARGVPTTYVEQLEQWVQGDLRPHLTLYLDLDPAIGMQRIAGRAQDRMEQEQMAFFQAVREGYLARAAHESRITTIDASQPLAAVQAELTACVEAFLAEHGA